jgi:hypothetical protein
VYLLRQGRLVFSGTAVEARDRLGEIEAQYLTATSA